jgi:hypothetical protein
MAQQLDKIGHWHGAHGRFVRPQVETRVIRSYLDLVGRRYAATVKRNTKPARKSDGQLTLFEER